MRLAIIATQPVQYNSPWFRMLSESHGIDLRVFFTWHCGDQNVVDPGFGKQIQWDIPLLDGFAWELAGPSRLVERRTFWNMNSPQLIKRVKLFGPDAILIIGWNYLSHLRAMRAFHGHIPVLFRGDSTLLGVRGGLRAVVRKAVLRWVYSSVDYALSVGTNNTAYFRHHGLTENQIVTVPHAIDNQRFFGDGNQFDLQAVELREQLGFTADQIVLLFAGKFERVKAVDRLIRAYRIAVKSRPEMRLLIVGNGPMESALRHEASDLPGVVFLPFQNQSRIPIVYRVGDITALPSSSETWGLCLNESMACGRTVLASDRVGAAVDLVREGITGFQCRVTESSIADTLVRLPSRTDILRLGSNCQEFIREWSFDTIRARIASLLKSLKLPANGESR